MSVDTQAGVPHRNLIIEEIVAHTGIDEECARARCMIWRLNRSLIVDSLRRHLSTSLNKPLT